MSCDCSGFNNAIPVIEKSIGAVETFAINWGENWLDEGETIEASEWETPDGITVVSDDFDDTTTTIKLSGGELDKTYRITNHITSSQGEQDDKSIDILVIQK
jgi:hypothetical protein